MFPITDNSETIIACLMKAADDAGVELKREVSIKSIKKCNDEFHLETSLGLLKSKKLLLATGSSPAGHEYARQLGHTITPLAPSLFSFNLPNSPYLDLSGISLPHVEASIQGSKLKERGPILFTHWGFSGPAILRLSAWGARVLQEMGYKATLKINWAPEIASIPEKLQQLRKLHSAKPFSFQDLAPFPKNLSDRFLELLQLKATPYAQLKNSQMEQIQALMTQSTFQIDGKTTNKQEFVTCGGVALKEVHFSTMESKLCPGLYFAGEILDIDGITGGFNFQNAWTTAWIAGQNN
ncbi:MAG: aminoacetone oxidase family FAD-binding enzyme, partial [Parachlamydiaceae bacterium]